MPAVARSTLAVAGRRARIFPINFSQISLKYLKYNNILFYFRLIFAKMTSLNWRGDDLLNAAGRRDGDTGRICARTRAGSGGDDLPGVAGAAVTRGFVETFVKRIGERPGW
jgi:hypothetical protein